MSAVGGNSMSSQANEKGELASSADSRLLRIMSEYVDPIQRFNLEKINNAIVVFGSARIQSNDEFNIEYEQLRLKLPTADREEEIRLERKILALNKRRRLANYYEETVELCRLLTVWSEKFPLEKRFAICTGGGPGIMEAANKGCMQAGGKSIGLNIRLPFEQEPNLFISEKLNFEFHYFFMRKFWFTYLAKAFVVMPGGFGTLDEFMETMTLLQTQKIPTRFPVVLYGEEFWRNTIQFEYLESNGLISVDDLSLFKFINNPDEAFLYISNELTSIYDL